jgi:hypothetical protein
MREYPENVHKVATPEVEYPVVLDDESEVKQGTLVPKHIAACLKLAMNLPGTAF